MFWLRCGLLLVMSLVACCFDLIDCYACWFRGLLIALCVIYVLWLQGFCSELKLLVGLWLYDYYFGCYFGFGLMCCRFRLFGLILCWLVCCVLWFCICRLCLLGYLLLEGCVCFACFRFLLVHWFVCVFMFAVVYLRLTCFVIFDGWRGWFTWFVIGVYLTSWV